MFGFDKQTELEKIAQRELTLFMQMKDLDSTIDKSQRAAAAALVESGDSEVELELAVRLKARREVIGSAITAVRGRRHEAIRADFQVKAGELRATAAKRRAELASLEEKKEILVAQLAALEATNIGIMGGKTFRSAELRTEASRLEHEAKQLNTRPVPAQGFIDIELSSSDEELFEAILQHPSEIPTLDTIEKWLSAVAVSANSRRPMNAPVRAFKGVPRRVRISWQNGMIDESSYVSVVMWANPRAIHTGYSVAVTGKSQEELEALDKSHRTLVAIDPAVGTFRAAA